MGRRQLPKKEIQRRRAELRRLFDTIDVTRDWDKRMIGEGRENLVRETLEQMRQWGAIASFRMTSHWDGDDLRGIDAFVYDFAGGEQPLQVKGSWAGVREHHERYPEIPCVMVNRDQSKLQVAVLISRALRVPLPGQSRK